MRVFVSLFSGIAMFPFTGVGIANIANYDGHYRYPCQDAEVWMTADCQPPLCLADSTCSMNLVPEEAMYVEE